MRLSPEESAALRSVEHFVHLDRSGARLDPNRRHSVNAVLSSPDETEWDRFLVISSWRHNKPQVIDGAMVFPVQYTVEGLMSGDTFTPTDAADADTAAEIEANSNVSYTAKLQSGEWILETPATLPHVSFAVARDWAQAIPADAAIQELADAEYTAKLKSQRSGHCNCGRLDF